MKLNCKTEAHVAETIAAPACTTLVFDQEFYTSIFGIEFGGGHDGHDHGGAAFEWGGLFDLPAGDYTWRAQKVDNAYADPKGGLSQCMALLVNALSGVSVFIGAAVFLATKPGYGTQGLLLAFSGGVYVYVAATEAAHTFLHKPLSICMKFGVFICFAIGAVAIGLVLLDHEHCSGNEGGSGDAHAGHNH